MPLISPVMSYLLGEGIKAMLLSDVCLSVIYIAPKLTTERPRKTKTVTEVAHVTRDSDTIKGQRSTCRGGGILWRLPAQLVLCARYQTHENLVQNLADELTDRSYSGRIFGACVHLIKKFRRRRQTITDYHRICS